MQYNLLSNRAIIEAAVNRLSSIVGKKMKAQYVIKNGKWSAELPYELQHAEDLMRKAEEVGISGYAGCWSPEKGNFLSIWEVS